MMIDDHNEDQHDHPHSFHHQIPIMIKQINPNQGTEVNKDKKGIRDYSLVRIKVDGRKVGSMASFACPPGYEVVGTNQLICLENGSWSAGFPACQGLF